MSLYSDSMLQESGQFVLFQIFSIVNVAFFAKKFSSIGQYVVYEIVFENFDDKSMSKFVTGPKVCTLSI